MTTFKVGDRVRLKQHTLGCYPWYVGKTAKVFDRGSLEYNNIMLGGSPHVYVQLEELYPGMKDLICIYWTIQDLELVGEESSVSQGNPLQPEPPLKLDEFHYHAALDRTHMLLVMLEESLEQHPVLEKHPALKDLYFEIDEKLGRLYQDIANFRPGKD